MQTWQRLSVPVSSASCCCINRQRGKTQQHSPSKSPKSEGSPGNRRHKNRNRQDSPAPAWTAAVCKAKGRMPALIAAPDCRLEVLRPGWLDAAQCARRRSSSTSQFSQAASAALSSRAPLTRGPSSTAPPPNLHQLGLLEAPDNNLSVAGVRGELA